MSGMKKMKTVNLSVIPKTMEGLRDALFDQINSIREGKGSLQEARAIAQLAAQAIDSVRVQIQYGRMIMKNQETKHLELGSSDNA